jgi:hypothetical protein
VGGLSETEQRDRVHLVLDVEESGEAIRFKDRCGKSFTHHESTWRLAERDGRTHITYELAANPSFEVPEQRARYCASFSLE